MIMSSSCSWMDPSLPLKIQIGVDFLPSLSRNYVNLSDVCTLFRASCFLLHPSFVTTLWMILDCEGMSKFPLRWSRHDTLGRNLKSSLVLISKWIAWLHVGRRTSHLTEQIATAINITIIIIKAMFTSFSCVGTIHHKADWNGDDDP